MLLAQKQKNAILTVFLAGLVAGAIVSFFQKPYAEASRSFIIENRRQSNAASYDYEGYYTLQTANETAKNLVSWLTSPGGVTMLYQDAGLRNEFRTLKAFEQAFSIRRADTPFFEVRFEADTEEDAAKLANSLQKLLASELAAFQNSSTMTLGSSPAVIMAQPVPYLRNVFYGGLLGFMVALFAVLFQRAMEADKGR